MKKSNLKKKPEPVLLSEKPVKIASGPGIDKDKLARIAVEIPVETGKEPVNLEPVKPEDPSAGVEALKEMLPVGWAHKIGCGLLKFALFKFGKEQLSHDEQIDLQADHDKFEAWILAKLPAWLQKMAADNGPGINLLAAYSMLILFKSPQKGIPQIEKPVKTGELPVNPEPEKPVITEPVKN